jgi:hypothetical protein
VLRHADRAQILRIAPGADVRPTNSSVNSMSRPPLGGDFEKRVRRRALKHWKPHPHVCSV